MIDRRTLLLALPSLALSREVLAGPSPQERKLANRLELWSNYARRTTNLMARLSTRRETSLLEEPLLSTGTLVFLAPDRLVLREDGRQGATTDVDGDSLRIVLNARGLEDPDAVDASRRPAARWLAQRLVRLFAPGDTAALLEDTRPLVPKGRGYMLELLPPRGSATRRRIRSVTAHLDPVAGSVSRIIIAEAQGDRITMSLSDHRQNLPEEDVESFLAQLEP